MDGYESNRRDFLKKLGLIAGATAITVSGVGELTNLIDAKLENYVLKKKKKAFLVKYGKWLDEFHDMAKFQKVDAQDIENNKKLVALSEDAKLWQKEIIEHMKDENFARHFMILSEKVTLTI